MLGSMLTKEEVEEFMREADVVSSGLITNVTMKKIILKHVMGSLNIFLIFPISNFTSRMEMENWTMTNLLR